jgi:hypothetical protein
MNGTNSFEFLRLKDKEIIILSHIKLDDELPRKL